MPNPQKLTQTPKNTTTMLGNDKRLTGEITTKKLLKFFLIISALPFTIEGAKPSEFNQVQKKSYQTLEEPMSEDYPSMPPSPPTRGCSLCKDREALKNMNLAMIKDEILKRMGLSRPPNITGKILPQVPAHYLAQVEEERGYQSDQPYKTGESFTEEDDDYHVRTQKVLTWAENCEYFTF